MNVFGDLSRLGICGYVPLAKVILVPDFDRCEKGSSVGMCTVRAHTTIHSIWAQI